MTGFAQSLETQPAEVLLTEAIHADTTPAKDDVTAVKKDVKDDMIEDVIQIQHSTTTATTIVKDHTVTTMVVTIRRGIQVPKAETHQDPARHGRFQKLKATRTQTIPHAIAPAGHQDRLRKAIDITTPERMTLGLRQAAVMRGQERRQLQAQASLVQAIPVASSFAAGNANTFSTNHGWIQAHVEITISNSSATNATKTNRTPGCQVVEQNGPHGRIMTSVTGCITFQTLTLMGVVETSSG